MHRKNQGKLSRSGKRQEIDEAADGGASRHASILFALVPYSRSTRDQKMERTLRTGTLFRRLSIFITYLKQSARSDWLIQRLLFAHGCTLLTCVLMFTKQIF